MSEFKERPWVVHSERVNAAAQPTFSTQDQLHIRTGEKDVGGAGLAGPISLGQIMLFSKMVPCRGGNNKTGRDTAGDRRASVTEGPLHAERASVARKDLNRAS